MAGQRHFGPVAGVPVGRGFANRSELAAAGVHRPLRAGISGSALEGADSIVLNGGYEDDKDYGEVILYTGHGGNDPYTKKQITHQELRGGNLALAKSRLDGLPVRVIRGWREPSGYAPSAGFRYDGLYRVEDFWPDTGRSGHRIWRFRLVRDDPDPPPWQQERKIAESPPRHLVMTQRIVRNTLAAQQVKELHNYHCQVCGLRLETRAGPYAEAAHIRPLGTPHDGPDDPDNILCLCPNHHVLLDTGAITIRDDLTVIDALLGAPVGRLRTVAGHQIRREYLAYQRGLSGLSY